MKNSTHYGGHLFVTLVCALSLACIMVAALGQPKLVTYAAALAINKTANCVDTTCNAARLAQRASIAVDGSPLAGVRADALVDQTIRLASADLAHLEQTAAAPTDSSPFKVIAKTGDDLESFGRQVSINDQGIVAFIGNYGADVGQGLFVSDASGSSIQNIAPGFKNPERSFGPGIQINNSNLVVARDWVSGVDPVYCLRRWNANSRDTYVIVADGGPGGIGCGDLSPDLGSIFGWPTMNATGQIAYLALHKTDPLNLLVTDASPKNWLTYKGLSLRPFMADDGSIIVRHTTDATNPTYRLLLVNYGLTTSRALATTPSDFSALGRSPGISDDAQVVTFYGDLTAIGAAALNAAQQQPNRPVVAPVVPVPGIFASIDTTQFGRITVQVAGTTGTNAFTGFEADVRVGVNGTQNTRQAVTVVFMATRSGKKGIYVSDVKFNGAEGAPYDAKNPASITVQSPALVAEVGQNIPNFGTLTDMDLYDPINSNEQVTQVAFWASAGSTDGVIRWNLDGVSLIGLEVTQAIQDLKNSVVLIKDRRTVVRAHLRSTNGEEVKDIKAQLIGRRGGVQIGTLEPDKHWNRTVNPTSLRSVPGDNPNFELPSEWLQGTVELELKLTSDHVLLCNEPADTSDVFNPVKPAVTGTAGDCKVKVSFVDSPKLEVTFVPIDWQEEKCSGSDVCRNPAEQTLRAVLPIPSVKIMSSMSTPIQFPAKPKTDFDMVRLLIQLGLRKLMDGCGLCTRVYLGLIAGDSYGAISGQALPLSDTLAVAYVRDSTQDFPLTVPHEVGHLLGRSHVLCSGNETGPDLAYPYPGGKISRNASGPDAFYGFDAFQGTVPMAREGTATGRGDLMSYCIYAGLWVSDYTYEAIQQKLASSATTASQETSSVRSSAATGDAGSMLVTGIISPTAGMGKIESVYVVEPAVPGSLPPSGSFALRLEDGSGQTLATYSFEPEPISDGGADGSIAAFAFVLPHSANIRAIRLLHNGQVIDSRLASSEAPTVTVVHPNGGEIMGNTEIVLSWAASDPDNDALSYVVQYSEDAGATWHTLVTGWSDTSYPLDLNIVPGSDLALVRVLATDGFYTAQDQSNTTFTVPRKGPQSVILSPGNSDIYFEQQTMILTGEAYDLEDGQLAGNALSWSSNLDGNLGTGKSLAVVASDLTEGTHLITLTTQDSHSQVGVDSITLDVFRQRPVFPTELDQLPAQVPFAIDLGSIEPITVTLPIRNAGDGDLNWTSTVDQSWLQLSAASGAAPANLELAVNPAGLPAGIYTGTITLTAVGALNSPQTVQVALQVGSGVQTPTANLSLAMSDGPDPVVLGNNVAYAVTVVNNGPNTANGVVVTDNLPASANLVSAVPSQGSCTGAATVTCQLGALAAGGSATVNLVAKPTTAGLATNSASVTATEADPNMANNSAMQTTAVTNGPADEVLHVTKTADTADGVCDADCSLREAISAANASPGADVITVPAGTYNLTLYRVSHWECGAQCGTLKITGPTIVNGVGAGVTIVDGSGLAYGGGVFDITGQDNARLTVTLMGLTLRNGSHSGGNGNGIAASYADLILDHTEVINNTGGGDGGGISFYSGSLTLRSSTVASNKAGNRGGGILASEAIVTLLDSQVVSNTVAGNAGGIGLLGSGTLTVLTSTVSGNTASGSGGGIYFDRGFLFIQGSTIAHNTANSGGGVNAQLPDHLSIAASHISGNTATTGGGGGLRAAMVKEHPYLDITDSTIDHNTAADPIWGDGGGIYLTWMSTGQPATPPHATIADSAITDNFGLRGGGILVDWPFSIGLRLTRTTISRNWASDNGGGVSFGGDGSQNLTLVDSVIHDNVVRKVDTIGGCGEGQGGGILAFSIGLVVTGTTFSNNRVISDVPACYQSAGGGVAVSNASYTITDSVFTGNSAETGGGLSGGGGGVVVYQNTIRNTQFLNNTAFGGSGGGFIGNDNITAIGVTLQGNSATGDGGGAYGYGTLALSQSLVKDNTAGGNGGGLSGGGQVLSSTITGNRAANGGGISAGTIEIVASTISANTAITDGGAIYVPGAYRGGPVVTVRNSTLSGNSAGRQGGAFSDFGGLSVRELFISRAHFHSTSIINNSAPTGSGGGLYHAGHYGSAEGPQQLTLEDVLLSGNTGGNCGGAVSAEGFVSQGHNLSSDGSCPALTGPGDLKKTAAKVGPLQNNGGSAQTHALLDGSPAIDAGGAADCPDTDQRGIARPQGGGCDIGAFEWQPTAPYLHLSPTNLAFNAVFCAAPPPSQPIAVTNTGAGTLNWTATSNQAWLGVNSTSGTVPANPLITVNQTGLSVGTHSGAVTLVAVGVGGSPQSVGVTLSVVRDGALVRNSGFEAEPNSDWAESSSTFQPLIRSASELGAYIAPHGGNSAALMGVVNGEISELTQSVLVPPGVTTLLKYWYYVSSPESDCDYDTAVVQVGSTTVHEHPLCQSGNTTGWVEASVPLTTYGGQQVTLRFRVDNDPSSDPSVFMLDDVRLALDPPCTVQDSDLPPVSRVLLPLVVRDMSHESDVLNDGALPGNIDPDVDLNSDPSLLNRVLLPLILR